MVKIRKATTRDAGLIVEMFKEFMTYHKDVIKVNPKLKQHLVRKESSPAIFKKYILGRLKSRDAAIFIAEVDGKPAGYLMIFIRKNTPIFKMKKLGEISDLFVKKEYRGLGISMRFRIEAEKWFKKKGMKYMVLLVYPDNKRAYSIYKKWRFFDFHTEMRKKI